ncbi:Tripartite tricarboxylate transporter family receptor [Pigmentiphaga humi]|uniref:Tripartite tricarboxylate transporter family receptor n=1 Tax=Pigmentiphaga humi TaxID=2478468 RepID=A0A3P4B726_9BURK|nr:tripartite tricarboxylate transporter substrate-binding protein [Pigmentiphaga humi]VCU71488.1 Tripartite tricarboxylate transporter family receptor [Pigmentiphaga humi]
MKTRMKQAGGARRSMAAGIAAACCGLVFAAGAQAQDFPKGTVKLVVPGPAGSSIDNVARALAEHLGEAWRGTPVIIENRPGASTTIGAAWVAKAPADGHTLLLTPTPFAQTPFLYRNLPYDPVKSFAPVAQIADSQLWLAIGSDIPARTVGEFVALAKGAPGKYSYASAGAGTTLHLYGYELAKRGRVDLMHIPYKGVPPAVIDVAGGRVSAIFAALSDLEPQVQAHKLRILASTGAQRSSLTPDMPTLKELGFDGFETAGFLGLFAPAGTPAPVVEQIARAVSEAIATPRVGRALASYGYEPVRSSPQAFAALLKTQLEVWRRAIGEAGVQME